MSGFFAENFEPIGSEAHESFKHASEQLLDLHIFLDLDWDAHTVDARLNQAALLITLSDDDWFGKECSIVLELDLWVNLTLNHLGGEVAQIEHGLQVHPDVAQVVSHSLCHLYDSSSLLFD